MYSGQWEIYNKNVLKIILVLFWWLFKKYSKIFQKHINSLILFYSLKTKWKRLKTDVKLEKQKQIKNRTGKKLGKQKQIKNRTDMKS